MGTDPQTTDWHEVGERFNRLGRALHNSWVGTGRDGSGDHEPADEVRSAMRQVNESLDRLADAITHAANDPEVRTQATSAAGGLMQAIGASLDDLAQRIHTTDRRDDVAPGDGRRRGTDV